MSHETKSASLRSYLLGTASDEQCEAFTYRVLAGDLTLAEAGADEDDLFDEYARGEMGRDDSERFADVALQHSEGRRRLDFARTLAARVDRGEAPTTAIFRRQPAADGSPSDWVESEDRPQKRGWWKRLQNVLWAPPARPVWALGCALLLSLVLWQARQLADLETSSASEETGPAPTVAQSAATAGPEPEADSRIDPRLAEIGQQVERLQSTNMALQEQLRAAESRIGELVARAESAAGDRVAQAVRESFPIVLTAATRGSRIARFKVPQETKQVMLEVELSDARSAQRVNARLVDATGFPVWGRRDVPTEEGGELPAVRLPVPAESLQPGTYTLWIEDEAEDEMHSEGTGGLDDRVAQFDFIIDRD